MQAFVNLRPTLYEPVDPLTALQCQGKLTPPRQLPCFRYTFRWRAILLTSFVYELLQGAHVGDKLDSAWGVPAACDKGVDESLFAVRFCPRG